MWRFAWMSWWARCFSFVFTTIDYGRMCGTDVHVVSLPKKLSAQLHHHRIVTFSQRENVPVGPSGPSSATRTASREPSSTDSVPAYPLRFVLVKPGETKLTLNFVDSSSITMASVMTLRAVLEAG